MAMLIDVLRHGAAVPGDPRGDGHRRLTEPGRAAIQALAARLAADGARPELVLSSPLVRAHETARLIVAGLGLERPIEMLHELAEEAEPAAVLRAMERVRAGAEHVMLVGHQPQMSRIVLHLTGREEPFAPGTLVRIEIEDGLEARTGRVRIRLGAGG